MASMILGTFFTFGFNDEGNLHNNKYAGNDHQERIGWIESLSVYRSGNDQQVKEINYDYGLGMRQPVVDQPVVDVISIGGERRNSPDCSQGKNPHGIY